MNERVYCLWGKMCSFIESMMSLSKSRARVSSTPMIWSPASGSPVKRTLPEDMVRWRSSMNVLLRIVMLRRMQAERRFSSSMR